MFITENKGSQAYVDENMESNAVAYKQSRISRTPYIKFTWIDMDVSEMQLIEFQSSSIWKQKFIVLRVDLENIEKSIGILEKSAENELLRAWNAILEY